MRNQSQGQRKALISGTHKFSCTYYDDYKPFLSRTSTVFMECYFIAVPNKNTRQPIWPCHKKVKANPRSSVWTTLVVLVYPVLHTKLHTNKTVKSFPTDTWRWFEVALRLHWCNVILLNQQHHSYVMCPLGWFSCWPSAAQAFQCCCCLLTCFISFLILCLLFWSIDWVLHTGDMSSARHN